MVVVECPRILVYSIASSSERRAPSGHLTLHTASRSACVRPQSSQLSEGVRRSYDNPCGSRRKAGR